MAFVPTQFDHASNSSSASAIASASKTFTSGRLYLVFTGGSGATPRTVSSFTITGPTGSLTAFPSGNQSYNDGTNWSTAGFYSTDLSGTGTVQTNFSGAWSLSQYIIMYEIPDGFDTSGLLVQDNGGSQAPVATSATLTLNDSAAAGNMRIMFGVHRINESLSAGGSGTVIEQTNATPANVKGLWYKTGDATTDPSMSWATNTRGMVFTGGELKAATVATFTKPLGLLLRNCG